MEALELKYDVAQDSWILEPTKSFKTPTPDHRQSATDASCTPVPARSSYSSAAPLSSFSPAPSPLYFSDLERHGKGRFWMSVKRYWTCFKPPTDHHHYHHHQHHHRHHYAIRPSKKEKQKTKPCKALSNTRSLEAQFRSSTNNHNNNSNNNTYYTAMNAEEREENLEAVVLYCKRTSTQRIGDV